MERIHLRRAKRDARAVVTLASLAVVTSLGVTGCDPPKPPETVHAVMVIADRANMPALVKADGTSASEEMNAEITRVAAANGSLTMIRSDGAPAVFKEVPLKIDTTSSTTVDDSVHANSKKIAAAMKDGLAAAVGEADPITALDVVSRSAAATSIDVFDNGLSTTGPLLLQTGVLSQNGDTKKLVAQLEQQQVLGSLKGRHITWYGLGEVASPQGRVPAWALTQLTSLYTALIKDAGGTVEFKPLSASGGQGVTTPKVSVVPFQVTSISASPGSKPPATINRVLSEQELGFIADSTNFSNPSQAKTVLSSVASQLSGGGFETVYVYGCTARPQGSSDAGLTAFGLQRAQRVVAELKSLGVKTALQSASFGWACPGYVKDSDAQGNLIEDLASRNRRVIVTSQILQSVK